MLGIIRVPTLSSPDLVMVGSAQDLTILKDARAERVSRARGRSAGRVGVAVIVLLKLQGGSFVSYLWQLR